MLLSRCTVAVGVGVGVIGGGVGVQGGPWPWHQLMLTVSTRQPSLEPLVSLAIRQRKSDCGKNSWQVDHGRDEALRVAAPCLTTSNRTTAIGADGAVIAAHDEAPASGKNILKRISTVSAQLPSTPAVKAEVRILARRFKIEVLPKGQTTELRSEELRCVANRAVCRSLRRDHR